MSQDAAVSTTVDKAAFLAQLLQLAKEYAYVGDDFEVRDFVRFCYRKWGEAEPTDAIFNED